MSFIIEKSTSTSLPSTVNVSWGGKLKDKVKKKCLSIYDKGYIEVPTSESMEGQINTFYSMKKSIYETREKNPQISKELNDLDTIVEFCIDSVIDEEAFDFKIAYSTVGCILDNLKSRTEKGVSEDLKINTSLFSRLSSSNVCPYCYFPIARYPYIEQLRCPSCGNNIKPPVYDSLIGGKKKKVDIDSLIDHFKNIKGEIKKRAPLYKNLHKMMEGETTKHISLKAALSCLTRIVIEDEKSPGKGILESFGEPLLFDIATIFLDGASPVIQKKIGSYFCGEGK